MTPDEFYKMILKKRYSIEHRPQGQTNATSSGFATIGHSIGVVDSPDYSNRKKTTKGECRMKLKDFCSIVAKEEGKKSQVSIGNIREIVKVINSILSKKTKENDFLYKIIRKL